MSEQLTLHSEPLPALLTLTFGALEQRAGRRLSVLSAASVIRCRGRWWLEVIVDGREHFALMGRADLEVAAADLFHRVHGTPPPGAA